MNLPQKTLRRLFSQCKIRFHDNRRLCRYLDCSHSTLKRWRRQENTVPRPILLKLIAFLTSDEQKKVLSQAIPLSKNWGQSKGGKTSVLIRKERFGDEGFLQQLATARSATTSGGLAGWHREMKNSDPKEYYQLQQNRWLRVLEFYRTSEKVKTKRVKTLKKTYGKNYFVNLGLRGAEANKLTPLERSVACLFCPENMVRKSHVTFYNVNIDFVYADKGRTVFEEVQGARNNKSLLFYDLATIVEKIKTLRSHGITGTFLVTTLYKSKRRRGTFHGDMGLWLLEHGAVPIFIDDKCTLAVRKNVLLGQHIERNNIANLCTKDVVIRNANRLRVARGEVSKKFDAVENEVHNALSRFSPKGKAILETRFRTCLVSDNSFVFRGEQFVVFVSRRSMANVIGACGVVKELVSPAIKTVAFVEKPRQRERRNGVSGELLNRYVDYMFYNTRDLHNWACRSTVS